MESVGTDKLNQVGLVLRIYQEREQGGGGGGPLLVKHINNWVWVARAYTACPQGKSLLCSSYSYSALNLMISDVLSPFCVLWAWWSLCVLTTHWRDGSEKMFHSFTP